MLLDDSARYALPRWRAWGLCHQGVLTLQRGDPDGELRLLHAAFAEPAAAGSAPRLFAFLISAASDHAGLIAGRLPAFEEAIVRAELTEERWFNAELLRIKGELLLSQGAPGAAAKAEGHFGQALGWARRQGALSWELRAATSLARLQGNQGRSSDATALLQSVYDRFIEGFDTADLKAAKALLDELS
jgi:predicted ATPase